MNQTASNQPNFVPNERKPAGGWRSKAPMHWPTAEWQSSTPEKQGVDSRKLLAMVAAYQKKQARDETVVIDSITIIRNGFVVADLYFNPLFPPNTPHVIHSCTKSIMSALIGIAIEQGYISGVDVPVLDYLSEKAPQHPDQRLHRLTLKDLLSMQTGLRSHDSYLYQWRRLFEMQATADWTKFILQLPFDAEPGTRFDYSNMSSFLLAAIVQKATGTDVLTFAKEHLFEPLGIHDVRWATSPQEVNIGWARMWLKPHDMAKFGLLYLHKGRWESQQVVPAAWVQESTTAHGYPKKYRHVVDANGVRDRRVTIGQWIAANLVRPFADGYGYQWWLDKSGMYTAMGVGGQFITVVPEKNLVVVFTSKLSGINSFYPVKLLKKYILPAIVSDGPISAEPSTQQRLTQFGTPPTATDDRKPIPQAPPTAQRIAGATYALDPNPWHVNDMQLVFTPNGDAATLSYIKVQNEVVRFAVGLDNVHRVTTVNGDTYAAVGAWIDQNTFRVDYEIIGYSTRGKWTLTFSEDEISVDEVGPTGQHSYRGRIR